MISTRLYSYKQYTLLALNHKKFHKRIRIHLGKGSPIDFEELHIEIKYQLIKYEKSATRIGSSYVEKLVKDFLAGSKVSNNIFTYLEEYLNDKRITINPKLAKPLNSRTICQYKDSLNQFKNFIKITQIEASPGIFDKQLLDNFYYHLIKTRSVSNNTAVKRHKTAKSFLKWLANYKGLNINPKYRLSVFNERYETLESDYALTSDQVKKLIKLKREIDSKNILPSVEVNSGISASIIQQQIIDKNSGIRLALDMFLIMCSTGMYLADMKASPIVLGRTANGNRNFSYYRTKTNELASGIPVISTDYSILPDLLEQYQITSGNVIGLKLSFTKLRKHLKTAGQIAGLSKPLQFKIARKTFASIFYYELKVEVAFISKLLGHTSSSETLKYLRISQDVLTDRIQDSIKNFN